MASTVDGATWNSQVAERDLAEAAAAHDESRAAFRAKLLIGLFLAGLFGVTFLQKFGFVTGSKGVLPVVLPLMIGSFLLACLALKPVFDPIRIGLYVATVLLTGLSSVFVAPTYSSSSLILLVLLYLPMTIAFETSDATYRRCMDAFVTVMLFFCGMIAVEHFVQFAISPLAWPDLNKLVSPNWLIPEYNYLQPIVWSLPYHKPNAMVFLEVSILSQFIALALAVEIALFQRPVRLAILAGGLMATFAGTGVLLMALTLPVLLGRLTIRQMVMVILALTVISYIAFKIGWFDIVSARMDEYKQNGSSANMRFIEPLDRLIAFVGQDNALVGGIGAGQIEKGRNFQWWPFTKSAIEYGLIPAFVFYAFFLYALFKNAPYRTLAFVLAVWYTFEGALLTAINPLTCVLLSTMFFVRRDGGATRKLALSELNRSMYGKTVGRLGPATAGARASAPAATTLRDTGLRDADPRPAPRGQAPDPPSAPSDFATPAPAGQDAAITVPDTGGRLIYAIGDIHGRADLLAPLIDQIACDAKTHPAAEQVMALCEAPEFEVHALLGNHEEAMLAYIDGTSTGVSFGRYGGQATLASYGVQPPRENEGKEAWEAVREPFRNAVPPAHVAFLRGLEVTFIAGDCLFVHAGLRAGVPIERQSRRDMLYIREEFFRAPVDCGKFIVHGHTPGETAFGAPGRLCLDTGAYASGILTAGRFDGGEPRLLQVGISADSPADQSGTPVRSR
jgi:hypothetical protein